MKLLYVFPEEFAGKFAREYHVYRLAESLAAAGCEVTLAAAPSDKISSADDLHRFFGGTRSEQLKVVWLPRKLSLGPIKIRSGAWFYHRLDKLIITLKPDLVYTMHMKAALRVGGVHVGIPLVFEAHEIFSDSYPAGSAQHRRLHKTEQAVYEHLVRAVVPISSYLAESLKQRFDVRVPVLVQHDGIDAAMLSDLAIAPDPHDLIYAGSLQPWKGVPVAIAAMRLLPEFHLTVLGGDGKALEEIRRDAPSNVTFQGQVTRDAMRPFLAKASIGLMPNLLEPRSALYTFPLKLLEYSAAGKGIVASHIPVFDGLQVSPWTELVPSGDAEALATGVRALTERGIGRGAAQEWAGQFLWQNQGHALKHFLDKIVTGNVVEKI
jgi:glycosyltransferase involved in cell wall biosynthesis